MEVNEDCTDQEPEQMKAIIDLKKGHTNSMKRLSEKGEKFVVKSFFETLQEVWSLVKGFIENANNGGNPSEVSLRTNILHEIIKGLCDVYTNGPTRQFEDFVCEGQ